MKTAERIALALAGFTLGVLASTALIAVLHPLSTQPTVAYCSAWENTSHPHLPANAYDDRCLTEHGTLEYAGK